MQIDFASLIRSPGRELGAGLDTGRAAEKEQRFHCSKKLTSVDRGKSRKNSEKPASVVLYCLSEVGMICPAFSSMQDSCKKPACFVDRCRAYRMTDSAPDWHRTGGRSYQINGTEPEATARKTFAASWRAASSIFSTSEKSPLFSGDGLLLRGFSDFNYFFAH